MVTCAGRGGNQGRYSVKKGAGRGERGLRGMGKRGAGLRGRGEKEG